jgi:hypothetical protein
VKSVTVIQPCFMFDVDVDVDVDGDSGDIYSRKSTKLVLVV